MGRARGRSFIAMFACVAACRIAFAQSLRWPLEDVPPNPPPIGDNPDRQLLATFEYCFDSEFDTSYIHDGIDIPAAPRLIPGSPENANAPWVIAIEAGTVEDYQPNTQDQRNYLRVRDAAGNILEYMHLTLFTHDFHLGDPITAGEELGRVDCWQECGGGCAYSHVHFTVFDNQGLVVSPFHLVGPLNDTEPPVIEDLKICPDQGDCDSVGAACGVPPKSCLPVDRTQLDIVSELYDKHSAGHSASIGDRIAPRLISWRACDESLPDCKWNQFLDLDTVALGWTMKPASSPTKVSIEPLFDLTGTCASSGDYCTMDGERFRYVVTNVNAQGNPDTTGAWDARNLPSGHYTVAVSATDYGDNTTVRSVPVCLHDVSGECKTTKLTVRDCEGDNGAEPSECDVGWLSPDIIENPDASGNPGSAVVAGSPNTIRVCATNTGCASISGDDHVSFALDWAITTASVPYPVGAIGGVAVPETTGLTAKDLTKRDGSAPANADWAVGEERCTDLKWTPSAGGHVCLVARVAHGTDVPTPGPAVSLDNNRAQHNLVLGDGTPLSPTAWYSDVEFEVSPLPTEYARSVVIQVDPDLVTGEHDAGVQIVSEPVLGSVVGGRVVGYVPRAALERWKRKNPLAVCERAGSDDGPCVGPARISPSDVTVVEISPRTKEVVLSNVDTERTANVELFARWESRERRSKPLEIRVRERIASVRGSGTTEIGGLTIRLMERSGASNP